MRGEDNTPVCTKINIESIVKDYAIFKVLLIKVLGSPPRSTTSLTLGIWLGFQYRHALPLVDRVLREPLVTTEVCVPLLHP